MLAVSALAVYLHIAQKIERKYKFQNTVDPDFYSTKNTFA